MNDKRVTVWIQHFKDRPHLVLQWLDPDTGRRKSKSAETADPKEAERARADLESDLNHGRHKEASRMTWEAFRDLFEAEFLPGRRPATRDNYYYTLELFERLVNPKNLRSITERTISLFVAALRKEAGRHKGETMQTSTIKVRLQFLHTVLAWAVKQKMLAQVPDFPTIRAPKKRPQAVPTESFEKVLDVAPDQQTRAYLLCGWLAGLRLSEAFELEWDPSDCFPWIDLVRNRIILPAERVKAVEDQWVPLDPLLREALEALPGRAGKVFHFTKRSGQPLSLAGVCSRVIHLAKRAGVRLTMKSLRRGFGCRYAGKVPAQVLQKLMRHANIQTTMDYYANVDEAAEAAVLGERKEQRNSSRNKRPQSGVGPCLENDANTYSSEA